jgi:hypothetical protein
VIQYGTDTLQDDAHARGVQAAKDPSTDHFVDPPSRPEFRPAGRELTSSLASRLASGPLEPSPRLLSGEGVTKRRQSAFQVGTNTELH